MKKNLFFTLFAMLFSGSLALAQCPVGPLCQNVDLDFQTSGNGANISHLPNWTYSHGSPSVSANGFWLWSYNNWGEGINYSGYNFVAGQQYTICFVAETETHNGQPANPNATFNIVGTNAPVGGFNTGSGINIPPVPGGSQVIVNENWSTYPNPGTGTYTYTFTAASNFNNLWFYPSSATLPQVEIRITQLVICQVEPCDASFTVCLNDQGNGTSAITTTLNNPNHTITGMRIWENNVLVYAGPWISYIGTNGNSYRICINAVNNNTGEECVSCYSFCIGKEEVVFEEKSNSGNLTYKEVLNNEKSSMPDALKDTPKELGISISPNPSNGQFEVISSESGTMTSVSVYDLNSREVFSKEISENDSSTRINLEGQPTGVYLLKVKFSDGSVTQEKIVLEK
ncbi:MAG: T9SS type A sorting domain-containing protein [Crocinitomicaceae bacterium]